MRIPSALLLSSLLVLAPVTSLPAMAQTACTTGLCLQQVSCPAGSSTTITGTVYAPNGVDPLPNVLVYIPNAAVDAFTPGVSCPVVGMPPSGSPIVGATTAVDGTFTITNVPVGTNIPLVIQTGRWRRQVVIPSTTSCANTALTADLTRMPRNQSEGDIPKIAVVTGGSDQVECVLQKVGIDASEFTDPSGTGRVNFYSASGSPGARISTSTPGESALMGTQTALNAYDVLMLPCEGGNYLKPAAELANVVQFANSGGRIYTSHYGYEWMYQNVPFNTVAQWNPNQNSPSPDPGVATVITNFSEGLILSQWLQLVGATTTQGQMPISTLRHDTNGVTAPTQSWLTLNNTASGNAVMQFVFNTPVGATANQCGRVLYNEYHVENPPSSPTNKIFPVECTTGTITPQEKLLEFSLFELTADGAAATLSPATQDFGSEPVNFTSGAQTFTWTNNSTFASAVNSVQTTGDFIATGNNCGTVTPGGSCSIQVVFKPTAVGARTGTLAVGSSGSTLLSQLTGTGIPDLVFSFNAVDFGSLDVGATLTKTLTVTNNANGPVNVPPLTSTGDFAVSTTCGNTVPALGTCQIVITFKPTVFGPRTGTLTVNSSDPAYSGTPTTLTGNGLDFTFVDSPTSGTVIAGHTATTATTSTPEGGFSAQLTLTCTTTAPGSVCSVANPYGSTIAVTNPVSITTTAQYQVIGYTGGTGGGNGLWILAVGSGVLLLLVRRRAGNAVRSGLVLLVIAAASLAVTGCSGKLPAQNANYTGPGNYTYTITATDGFLSRSATYALNVTVK